MSTDKVGRPRAYVNFRDFGRIDTDIGREDLAHQVVGAANWWQSEVVLFVATDGSARAYIAYLGETDREMKRRTADVVGTYPGHGNVPARRDKIKARILSDLRHHMGAPGVALAA